MVAGGFAVLAGIITGGLHLLSWLQDGVWPSYSTAQMLRDLGLGEPRVSWVGVQKILDWILAASAVGFLVWGGLMLTGIGSMMWEAHEGRSRDFERRRRERESERIATEREARYAAAREREAEE